MTTVDPDIPALVSAEWLAAHLGDPTVRPVDVRWYLIEPDKGRAIVEGWRAAGFDLGALTVIRPSGTEVEGVRTVSSVADAGAAPKLAVLAVKPQMLDEVASVLRQHLSAQTTLVSILATCCSSPCASASAAPSRGRRRRRSNERPNAPRSTGFGRAWSTSQASAP